MIKSKCQRFHRPPPGASPTAGPFIPGFLDPGVIYRRRYWGGDGVGADVADDVQRLLESVIHAQHFVSSLGLVS